MEEEVNLLHYWKVIKKRWKVIASIFGCAVVMAAIVSLLMTPIFQAEVTIMPIEPSVLLGLGESSSSSFLLPLFGGFSGIENISNKLVNILESRTLAEDVINRLNLTGLLFADDWDEKENKWKNNEPPKWEDVMKEMDNIVSIEEHKKRFMTGLISIAVEYKDPEMAAKIANEYMAALQRFLNEHALSLAKRKRIFIGDQIGEVKNQLAIAEEALKDFQTNKKVVALDAQTEAAITAIAEIRAQIAAKEVQLGVIREYATPKNPDVVRLQDALRELRKQLALLELKDSNPKSSPFPTISDAPEVLLEYIRLKRETMTQEKVFELLTEHYHLARIEEAKEDIAFQVIDPGITPEKRIRPKRALNVLLAGTVSLFMGIFLVFFLEYLENIKR